MESIDLLTRALRLINLYNAKSKKPYTYAGGLVLYPAQAHMIEIIGGHEGITATQIADEYMITKSAVSQILTFLCENGLIEKRGTERGGRTLALYLSEAGRQVLAEHRQRHKAMQESVANLAERLSPDALAVLEEIADTIEENIRSI